MRIFNYFLTACLLLNLTQANSQCNVSGSHYTASYPAGWTLTDMGTTGAGTDSYTCNDGHNGTIYVSGSAAYFISARGGRELRTSTAIPAVSNDNWTMDFTLIINPSFFPTTLLPTNSPAVVLAALTSDQMSLQSGCSGGSLCTPCGSYANTNMDAMWVSLVSNAPNGCADSQTGKAWTIVAFARDGNGAPNYSTGINIPTGVAGTYYIRLQRTNSGQAVVSVCSNSNYTGHIGGSPQCLSIPGSVKDLDVLSHEVMAQEPCTRTFNGIVDHLKIDNVITCPLTLNSSFTTPTTAICEGTSFTVNGSGSSSGTLMPIGNHMWVVEECDANGNQFGPVWFSPPISGAPTGNYTIDPYIVNDAGVYMLCNHYYKVSLVLMNCGNRWAPVSKVFTVKCRPYAEMSGSPTAAYPYSTINLVATVGGGSGGPCTVVICKNDYDPNGSDCLWSSSVLPNTPVSFQTTLTTSTTYYPMAYDINGCSGGGAPWDIFVTSPKAKFNVELTSLTASSFTVKTVPEDLTGYETPDFYYSNVIEELAEDGTALYSHTSTDCWGSYPDGETFKGFISAGTGFFDQLPAPNCGNPGQFQRERRYRLTAIAGTSESDEQQYSVIISVDPSGQLVVEEDQPKNAKAFDRSSAETDLAASGISIHPNPSTGVFIIELEKTAEGSLIEVTNALGQKVKTLEAKGLRSELNLTGFTKGIYIVTISSNGSKTTKKIILE